jgi:hypothetical protein
MTIFLSRIMRLIIPVFVCFLEDKMIILIVLFLTLFCIVIAILAIHLFRLLKGNEEI